MKRISQGAGPNPKKFRSLHQVSCGGVVVKGVLPAVKVCLIARKRGGRTIWCLPKGHVEKGETLRETALREIKEEAGITSSIQAPLETISYSFFDEPTQTFIFKKVHFFLAHYVKGNLSDHDDEVAAVRWFPFETAFKRLEYPSERLMLKSVKRKLQSITP